MGYRIEDFLVLVAPFALWTGCTRSPGNGGDDSGGDDGGTDPDVLCEQWATRYIQCNADAYGYPFDPELASYYTTYCRDLLSELQSADNAVCVAAMEDFFSCASTAECLPLIDGTACAAELTALETNECFIVVEVPGDSDSDSGGEEDGGGTGSIPDDCTPMRDACICGPGAFKCVADPLDLSCCVPCEAGNDNHLFEDTDQCSCNEGFDWCSEDPLDLSCCEFGG